MNSSLLAKFIDDEIKARNCSFYNKTLYLSEAGITPSELATCLNLKLDKILEYCWKEGQLIKENQIISNQILNNFAKDRKIKLSFNKEINFEKIIDDYLKVLDKNEQIEEKRAPVVMIMGHVDHGKTTLLENILNIDIQNKEVGGITQKFTSSEVELFGKKIIFVDTPGHKDFIKLREKGFSLADLVVIVISASDGIMSQTEEVIEYLNKYSLPRIFFVNNWRRDKHSSENNFQKVCAQLQTRGLLRVEWGGNEIVISGDAKDKESVNYLCENIFLLADTKANVKRVADGIIVDSFLHPQLKSVVTKAIVLGGTLFENSSLLIKGNIVDLKSITNEKNQKKEFFLPGNLVTITGLNFLPELGTRFVALLGEEEKKEISPLLKKLSFEKKKSNTSNLIEKGENFNLFLLAETQNSLEALIGLVEKVNKENTYPIKFWVIDKKVSKLNDNLINIVKITDSFLLNFGKNFSQSEIKMLKENKIFSFSSEVIYEIEKKLTDIAEKQKLKTQVEKIVGVAQITKIFYFSKIGNIAGCQVLSGKVNRNNLAKVIREEEEIFKGKIKSLQSNKNNLNEVFAGQECGIVLRNFDSFQENDKIVFFNLVEEEF